MMITVANRLTKPFAEVRDGEAHPLGWGFAGFFSVSVQSRKPAGHCEGGELRPHTQPPTRRQPARPAARPTLRPIPHVP